MSVLRLASSSGEGASTSFSGRSLVAMQKTKQFVGRSTKIWQFCRKMPVFAGHHCSLHGMTVSRYHRSARSMLRSSVSQPFTIAAVPNENFPVLGGEGVANRPLKINRDLLLYNGRLELRKSRNTLNSETKKRLLDSAESAFRKVISMDPTDARGYVSLGKLLQEVGRLDEAAQLYEEGCQTLGGSNAYIWQAWATLEGKRGNVSQARRLYDAAIVADPKHPAAWHGWGMLEMRQGDLLRARELFIRGLRELGPDRDSAYLHHSLAMLCKRLGRMEEARQWFEQGTFTKEGEGSFALWKDWGQLEAEAGDITLARKYFRKAIEINPRARHVYSAWAKCEKKMGSREAARKLLQTGVELNRTDHVLLQALAVMEAEDGHLRKARTYFAKSTRAQPRHMAAWQAWAIMEHQAGSPDRARELFKQALWCDPQHPKAALVFHAWGVMEEKEGNHDVARELFKCGIRCDNRNERLWLTWAEMEDRLGNEGRAIELRGYSAEEQVVFDFPQTVPGDVDRATLAEQIMAPVKDWFRAFTTAQESGQRLKPKLGLLTQEAIRSWGGSHDQGAGEGEATGPDAEAGEGTRVEYQEGVGEEEGGDERDGDGAADGAGPRGIFRGETQLGGGGGRTVTTMPRGARRT